MFSCCRKVRVIDNVTTFRALFKKHPEQGTIFNVYPNFKIEIVNFKPKKVIIPMF